MENSLINTYNVVGMKTGLCATKVKNSLNAVPGVISVSIDSVKSEIQVVSKKEVNIKTLEEALVDTDYYITEITPNVVPAPSFGSVVDGARKNHNSTTGVESTGGDSVNTGPATDYNKN